MTPKSVIYTASCTCHPEDGVRYVGQTIKGSKSRAHVHLWNSRIPESKSYRGFLSNWIRKHGEENIVFQDHEICEPDALDEREKYWIAHFRGLGNKLTNIRPGGGSERGYKNPLMSERMRGSGNPMYGKDRREVMAHARSFQGPLKDSTRAIWSEQRRGEGNPKAKLTEDQVREIRATPQFYGISAALSKEYGVSAAMISAIRLRRSWTHVE